MVTYYKTMIQRTSEVGRVVAKEGYWGKRLQLTALNSIVMLAIYGLDSTFKMNNNPMTTPV